MLNIREATLKDEVPVFELLKVLFKNASPGERVDDWLAMAREFRKMIMDGTKGTVFVAEENGAVLGLVTLSYIEAIRCGGIYGSIEEFVVRESARGKGVGGRLLEAVTKKATEKGCTDVVVNRPSNLGYPIYLRHGFKDAGKNLMMKLRG